MSPLALDHTGTQAAVYPSEEQLWTQGPPINAPGGQGVVADNQLGAPAVTAPPVSAPASWAAVHATEALIHEQINGQTANQAYDEYVVNNAVYGPQGFGDWNVQPNQSGHTQNIVSNPSQEQGWGVGPARRWAHYPKTDSPNPARNASVHVRNGELPWVSSETKLYHRTQLAYEQQWAIYKNRSPVAPVVPVAPSVPYVQTLPVYPAPTYSGGPVEYPGIDVPIGYYP